MDNPNSTADAVCHVDTFAELISPSSENSPMKPNLSIEDSFNPHGLKVLVVDNDPDSLLHLTEMLTSCQYQATTCSLPKEALALIKEDNNKFDIVVTEVHFSPNINGVEFLEIIVRETGLPVVIVSTDDSVDTITECIMKGACACIPKPAKKDVIQFIWQHVARRVLRDKQMKRIDKLEVSGPSSSNSVEDKDLCGSSSSDDVKMEDELKDKAKETRIVWTSDLDRQFVEAVIHLGIKKAVPKKVLEQMNVPGLKRKHVASHLQNYRKKLKMLSTNMEQRFKEQSSVSRDAYIPMIKNNYSFVSTGQPITKVPPEQYSSTQIPSSANSQVMENNELLLKCSPVTELQQHYTVQDSSNQLGAYSPVIENNWFVGSPSITNEELKQHFSVQDSSTQLVPNGAYHPVTENDWILGSPPITNDELKMLQQLEFDNPISRLHDQDYCL